VIIRILYEIVTETVEERCNPEAPRGKTEAAGMSPASFNEGMKTASECQIDPAPERGP
jgi:hypothetical protein